MKTNKNNIGKVFNNENGKSYIIIYENKERDRTLLLDTQTQAYIGAWGLNWKHKSWCQGHYFMENFKTAVNWVLGKE